MWGQPVTLTATVGAIKPGAGVPSGAVTFYDGTTSLGTATLSNGVATLTTTTLPVGTATLTADYQSDGNFSGSLSNALQLPVAAAPVAANDSSSPQVSAGTSIANPGEGHSPPQPVTGAASSGPVNDGSSAQSASDPTAINHLRLNRTAEPREHPMVLGRPSEPTGIGIQLKVGTSANDSAHPTDAKDGPLPGRGSKDSIGMEQNAHVALVRSTWGIAGMTALFVLISFLALFLGKRRRKEEG